MSAIKISQLPMNSTHKVNGVMPISTKFGDTFILNTDGADIFSTTKVAKFLSSHPLNKAFELRVGEDRTFVKDDREIVYREVQCVACA